MAKKEEIILDLRVVADKANIEKLVNEVTDKFTTSFATALSKGLTSAIGKFGANLGKSIQVAFDDSVVSSLKKPIKITLNTTDAKDQIKTLIKPLQDVIASLPKIVDNNKKGGKKGSKIGGDAATSIKPIKESLDIVEKEANALGIPVDGILRKVERLRLALKLIFEKKDDEGLFTQGQEQQLERYQLRIKELTKDIDILADKELTKLISQDEKELQNQKKAAEKAQKAEIEGEKILQSIIQKEIEDDKKFITAREKATRAGSIADSKLRSARQTDTEKQQRENALLTQSSTIYRNLNSTLNLYKNEIDNVNRSLKTFGLNEDSINKLTKNLGKSFTDVRSIISELGDEASKAVPDFDKLEKLLNKFLNNANTFGRNSNDLSTNIGGVLDDALREQTVNQKPPDRSKPTVGTSYIPKIDISYLDDLEDKLSIQRKKVTDLGVPLNSVIKQTQNYDRTLLTIRRDLIDVERELDRGNITVAEASKIYKKLTDSIRKLDISIDEIDSDKLKKAFDLEQVDGISYRLGILGFTLQTIGGNLNNISQVVFQSINTIGQLAEPIERVNNALALQVKQGEITAKQQEKIMTQLREIGDLPGSSVEDANKTFNSLQKVNISLEKRLELTAGIAKLAAAPGGEAGSAEQVTNALLNLANKGGEVDSENFKTLRVQGGKVFEKLNRSLGIFSASELEKFGVKKYLNEVAKALSEIESPADTTTDKFNRLRSRISELGVVFSKILGPGLKTLNILLKDIVKIAENLGDRFDKLSDSTKRNIEIFLISIPVIAGITGAFLGLVSALAFAVSGFTQIKNFLPVIKNAVAPLGATITGFFSSFTSVIQSAFLSMGKFTHAFSLASSTINASLLSFTTFEKFLAKIILGTKNLFTLFGTGTGIVAKFITSFTSASSSVSTVFAGASGFQKILATILVTTKNLFTSMAGGASIIKILSGGITGLLGGFAKILGFTNPIGIAINLILSVFTALWDNFNGIRDRLVSVFSDFMKALSNLTSALGLGPGGLYTMFKLLMDLLNGLFGFIGEVVIEILNSVVITLTNIANNIANVINLAKDGDWLGAIWEGIKLLFNALGGLIINLGISIVSTLIDAIASVYEYWGGSKDNFLRSASDGLRSLIGTDKASLQRKKADDEEIQRLKNRQDRELQINKQNEEAEEKRIARLEELDNQLKEITENAKEDFIKFQFDQAIDKLKIFKDELKEYNDERISYFKQLIDGTGDLTKITSSYNDVLKDISKTQKSLVDTQNKIGLFEALKEFNSQTSSTSKGFEQIYEFANQGKAGFKELADAIKGASSSTNLNGLQSSLGQIVDIANKIDPQLGVFIQNSVEKTRSVIENNSRETQKYIREYQKVLRDIRKVEEERKFAVEQEIKARKAVVERNKIEHEERLQEIKDATAESIASRNERLERSKMLDTKAIEDRKTVAEFNEKLRQTNINYKKYADAYEKYLDGLYADPLTSKETRAEIDDIYSSTDKFRAAFKKDRPVEYDETVEENTRIFAQFKEYQKTRDSLFTEQNKTKAREYYNSIVSYVNSLNSLFSSSGLDKLFSGFVSFLDSFSIGVQQTFSLIDNEMENTANTIGAEKLSMLFDELTNKTIELGDSGEGFSKIRKEIDNLRKGTISTADAMERFINIIARINSADSINARLKLQNELNYLIKDYNKNFSFIVAKNGITQPTAKIDEVTDPLSVGDLGKNLIGLTSGGFAEDFVKTLPTKIADSISKIVSIDGLSLEGGALARSTFQDENGKPLGNLNVDQFGQKFLELISGLNSEDATKLLDSLFNVQSAGDEGSVRSQIFSKLLETYIAGKKEKADIKKNELETKIAIIDKEIQTKTQKVDDEIDLNESKLNVLGLKIANSQGKERESLVKQQNEIKLRLIDFNYQKLDIETAYNIQKALLQAEGNDTEQQRIIEAGKVRRELLKQQRIQEIKDAVILGGGTVDKNGTLRNADGTIFTGAQSTTVNENILGTTDGTGKKVNQTKPSGGNSVTFGKSESFITSINERLKELTNTAQGAGQAILDMWNTLASGKEIVDLFGDLITGASFKLEDLGQTFKNVAEFAITAFGQALGQAITDTLLNGGNFLKNLKKFFGEILITMGQQLISLGAIATAIGLLALIPFFSYLDPDHKALVFGPIAIATGIAAVLAGKALGGGSASAETSNTNASNSANSSAGNSNQAEYDPEKDKLMIYQKALKQEIFLFVKSDDSHIVKAVVNGINRSPRLNNLMGTRSAGFAL